MVPGSESATQVLLKIMPAKIIQKHFWCDIFVFLSKSYNSLFIYARPLKTLKHKLECLWHVKCSLKFLNIFKMHSNFCFKHLKTVAKDFRMTVPKSFTKKNMLSILFLKEVMKNSIGSFVMTKKLCYKLFRANKC